MKLSLTLACCLSDRTLPLQNGYASPEGIDLNFIDMGVGEAAGLGELFRRQARHAEFDVSEFSLSTYTLLHARGDRRLVALPVFPQRRFRHSEIYVNTTSGIREPRDLLGKRVGIQEYQATAFVWIRGILQDEYGVRPDEIEWYTGPYSRPGTHSDRVAIDLPATVRIERISNERCLDELLQLGEIDALLGVAPPDSFLGHSSAVARLFPRYQEVESEYFRRTKIFPIMHTIVVKREIYEKAPWVAVSLCKAFDRAKEIGRSWLRPSGTIFCALPWLAQHVEELGALMGSDPFAYGLENNRSVLETFLRYSFEQGLTDRLLSAEELFAPETHGFA